MSSDESIEETQDNEFEALKAIYGADLKDLRDYGLNQWQPLNLVLTLTPHYNSTDSQENHVKLDLHVICSHYYPNEAPRIILEKPGGLSNTKIKELEHELIVKSKSLKGEVMIFELAQHITEFLQKNNVPTSKSCYEDMILRQQKLKRQEEEAEKIKMELQNQSLINEIRERHEILNAEKRKMKRLNSETSNDSEKSNRNRSLSGNYFQAETSIDLICDHKKTEIIEFTNNGHKLTIFRGRCLDHIGDNCINYTGMDQNSGLLYLVTEFISELKYDEAINKQIASFEQELHFLSKINHENLANYISFKHKYEENKVVIYLLQEFIMGSKCSGMFSFENIAVELDLLRHIAEGVLNALEFLHKNKIIHKELNGSCVYLTERGAIKVSNFSLPRRISDFLLNAHSSEYNKKTDVYNYGLFILSLISGCEIDSTNIEIPTKISQDLQDFLNNCLNEDEKYRYSVIQLLNHPFIKKPLSGIMPHEKIEQNVVECTSLPIVQEDLRIFAQPHIRGQSRVENEFLKLEHLGKGAYGDVFKVQNKLDQRFYALKRIELNPKNKQLNKKIIREVTLLSRLNHENVVRYYNSWIETAMLDSKRHEDDSTSEETDGSESHSINLISNVKAVEWSISYGHKAKAVNNTNMSSSDEEEISDDDESNWMDHLDITSGSDSIEFEHGDDFNAKSPEQFDRLHSVLKNNKEIQFMYIQMEFCEKSTLRTAIDDELYLDNERVWRLFREIIEGLSYIHQQGMIHRDLKPMNIFLDCNDHVKIGDFGLATTNLRAKPSETLTNNKSYYEDGSQDGGGDPSMTGYIGTALYVAPELASTSKAIYNQKVDIYSLGVIFFEMSYKPMKTGMERCNVLNALRSEKILFPLDFWEKATSNQEKIIRWLLDHNTSKRPTSQELLQSDYVPPPVLEECRLRELVRHTLSNTQLKGYKYLIQSCFKQPISAAQDITYDKDTSTPNLMLKNLLMYNHVKEIVIKVFKIHGGQELSTPILMPKSTYYEGVDSCVKLMTHSGSIVSLPHDLRVPFARYVAWNGITSLRRYSIERVLREKRVFGFIPRELYECAFDIVTPNPGCLIGDAELISILNEIVDEIPGLKNNNKLMIRLNHTSLIKAIFLHFGIKDNPNDLYIILSEAREGKISKWQLRTHFSDKGLSDNLINSLINILETEYEDTSRLQSMFKSANIEVTQYAKQSLKELKIIKSHAEKLGVTIVICPGLVYNVQQYSGMMCQLVCEVKRKHKHGKDVIAVGGRYDTMINKYRCMMMQANMLNKDIKQSAVGISISLDKLVQGTMQKDEEEEIIKLSNLDVVICSLGSEDMLGEKCKILHDLWSAGIRCVVVEARSMNDIQEQCNELNVNNVILLKETEYCLVRIRSVDKDYIEKKVHYCDIVETMQRIIKQSNENTVDQNSSSTMLQKSDLKVSHSEHNFTANVTIYFINLNEKLSASSRKRSEHVIRSQMTNVLKKLNGEVCLLAIPIENSVINTMANYLKFDSEAKFNKSVEQVKERHQKHKKYLNDVCDQIYSQKARRSNSTLILYSINDNLYRVLL